MNAARRISLTSRLLSQTPETIAAPSENAIERRNWNGIEDLRQAARASLIAYRIYSRMFCVMHKWSNVLPTFASHPRGSIYTHGKLLSHCAAGNLRESKVTIFH